jgi:hypothetical protein
VKAITVHLRRHPTKGWTAELHGRMFGPANSSRAALNLAADALDRTDMDWLLDDLRGRNA